LSALRGTGQYANGNEASLKTDIGQLSQDTQQIPNGCHNKLRRKPNELMPCTASRCHRYQLVERLVALHTSIPDAVELIEIAGVINNLAWP